MLLNTVSKTPAMIIQRTKFFAMSFKGSSPAEVNLFVEESVQTTRKRVTFSRSRSSRLVYMVKSNTFSLVSLVSDAR